MSDKKQPKYLRDQQRDGDYVRAWKEGKGRDAEIVVQVWKGKTAPEGEPDGEWGMPTILGVETSVSQAVIQTKTEPPPSIRVTLGGTTNPNEAARGGSPT